MNPLLLAAGALGASVLACYVVANAVKWATDRARARKAARRGGIIDFSRRRL